MTADECDHLVNISRPLVRRSPQTRALPVVTLGMSHFYGGHIAG